jgi:site-specific DNA-methyltransferase (adenine-specific)
MTPSALVICSDCLAGLRDLPDDSIDAVVTDPPSGIAFMGADWDKDKGGRDAWIDWLAEIMREVWRVTKPGGHALVWALPRTQHWTATAVENAGWEVRDVLMHVFGSGFPKSSNVSIQIDKQAGAMGHRGKAHHGHATGEVANGRENLNAPHAMPEHKGITPEAKRWAGWGTALKPSHEAWILARKPLSGTVAATVLEHGTGALNIDGCRVGTDVVGWGGAGRSNDGTWNDSNCGLKQGEARPVAGRWPPHLLLSHAADCGETCADGCPVAEMDAQSGVSTTATYRPPSARQRNNGIGLGSPEQREGESSAPDNYGDTGGASRFFPVFRYVAKPSTAEKSAGLGHRTPATGGEATGRKDGSAGLDNPRAGAGRNGGALNIHPTVKPRGLMEWLVKMITPPGGVVLDPFTGSGSTGVAAVGLGFDFIGFEMSEDFAGIARDRIGHAVAGVEIETVGIEDYEPKPEATGQGRLF